jgi:hypothetical protein
MAFIWIKNIVLSTLPGLGYPSAVTKRPYRRDSGMAFFVGGFVVNQEKRGFFRPFADSLQTVG